MAACYRSPTPPRAGRSQIRLQPQAGGTASKRQSLDHRTAMRLIAPLLTATALLSLSCAVRADYSSVNKSLEVPAETRTGDIESVNGSITMGDRVTASDVQSVNGDIRIGREVSIHSLSSVNGRVRSDTGLKVADEVSTVNGSVLLTGADVGGDIDTVNGTIELDGGQVHGKIEIVHADIELKGGARVDEGIVVRKNKGKNSHPRVPRIVIGPNSVVGPITLEGPAEVLAHDSATVGTVSGGSLRRFSGDSP